MKACVFAAAGEAWADSGRRQQAAEAALAHLLVHLLLASNQACTRTRSAQSLHTPESDCHRQCKTAATLRMQASVCACIGAKTRVAITQCVQRSTSASCKFCRQRRDAIQLRHLCGCAAALPHSALLLTVLSPVDSLLHYRSSTHPQHQMYMAKCSPLLLMPALDSSSSSSSFIFLSSKLLVAIYLLDPTLNTAADSWSSARVNG